MPYVEISIYGLASKLQTNLQLRRHQARGGKQDLKQRKAVVFFSLAVLLVTLASQCLGAISEWATRPGTVGNALSSEVQDGASVYLDAVIVDKIQARKAPHYFTVRECFDAKSKIVVNIPAPAELRHGQTVDISGVIIRLSDGNRAIDNASVFAYLSQDGDILYHGPLIKGPWNPTPWPYKADLTAGVDAAFASSLLDDPTPPGEPNTDSSSAPTYCETIAAAKAAYSATERILVKLQCRSLENPTSRQFTLKEDSSSDVIPVHYTNASALSSTDRINKIVVTIQKDAGTNYWIEVDSGPNWQSQDVAESVQAAPEGSILWVKTFPDFATLPVLLTGKVVSRAFPSLGYYYIQETSGSAGICVYDPGMALAVTIGDLVDISGDVSTDDGERVITASSTTITGKTTVTPRGLINRALAGGNYNVLTPGAQDTFGLNNVGLLVRAWGKTTFVSADYFYLDDGSGRQDGSEDNGTPIKGVRVVNATGYKPSVGDYIAVTGVSGLATYVSNYARTIRLAKPSDLLGITPSLPPSDLSAAATGSGKISLYWRSSPGATGYNVYRGTTSGGENYSSPVNGSIPVTTLSYSGGDVYTFTDTGLTNGVEYFYTVKAISSTSESQPSDEASCFSDPNGAPWDTGDVAAILASIRNSFPGISIPYGSIRARGPDGRHYVDGASTPIMPDVTIDPVTRNIIFSDGAMIAAPNDNADIEPESGLKQILTTVEPRIKNAQSGPFRKVYTHHNYRGVKGRFRLPDSSVGIRVTPYTYPSTGKSTKDVPYVYLGGLGNRGTAVDAGLYWGPTANNPQSRWRVFGKINNSKRDEWINTPANGIFEDNQDIRVEFVISSIVNGRVLLKVTPVGGSQTAVITMEISDFPKTGQGVHFKRVHSIAQNCLIGADKTNGYRLTGSYFQSSAWFDGQIMDQGGTYRDWGTSQTPSSTYHGRFPNISSIVNFQMQYPQNLYPSRCFSGDNYVHIKLQ